MSQATSRAGRGIIQLPGAANVFRSAVGRLKRPAPVPKIAGIPVARIRHGIAIARDPTRSGANTRYPATSLQENPGVLSEHLRSNDMEHVESAIIDVQRRGIRAQRVVHPVNFATATDAAELLARRTPLEWIRPGE
jgi:hypothetical protein